MFVNIVAVPKPPVMPELRAPDNWNHRYLSLDSFTKYLNVNYLWKELSWNIDSSNPNVDLFDSSRLLYLEIEELAGSGETGKIIGDKHYFICELIRNEMIEKHRRVLRHAFGLSPDNSNYLTDAGEKAYLEFVTLARRYYFNNYNELVADFPGN